MLGRLGMAGNVHASCGWWRLDVYRSRDGGEHVWELCGGWRLGV